MMRTFFVASILVGFAWGLWAGELIQGMNILVRGHERDTGPEVWEALRRLVELGAEWVAVVPICYQPRVEIPLIRCSPEGREGVRGLIRAAKSLGLKVLLKPHLDVEDGRWRGLIDFGDDEAAWAEWFRAYGAFILGYAQLAREEGVEMFCVGAELKGTVGRRRDWLGVIQGVRKVYGGPLIYAANWNGEMWEVSFWDALDYVGIDAYYPLTGRFSPTLDELVSGWSRPLNSLGCLAGRTGKGIIFTEVGYRSVDGAARAPWDRRIRGEPDPQEQALCYRAFFQAVWGKEPWFGGVFFWYWSLDPAAGGPADTGYTPRGKPAAEVLERWFAPD